MSEGPEESRRISWTGAISFTPLFKSFRLAYNPTTLALAFCAVLSVYLFGRILDAVWPESSQVAVSANGSVNELDEYMSGGRDLDGWIEDQTNRGGRVERRGIFAVTLAQTQDLTLEAYRDVVEDGRPWALFETITKSLQMTSWLFDRHPVFGVLIGIAKLCILALFGGAACRVIALQSARDERLGFGDALAFGRKYWLSLVCAPIVPIGALVGIGILLAIGGLIGAIPGLGPILVGILFFLALLAGFAMAFVLIGAAAGAALFYPAVAADGSDAIEAVSRSYSYVYQRPWRLGLYALVSIIYAGICLAFVNFMARLMLIATHRCVGYTMNIGSASSSGEASTIDNKLDAIWQPPTLVGNSPLWGTFRENLAGGSWIGQFFISLWIFAVVGLVAAFATSLFFAVATQIYLLLRREVDATDLEDVYLDDDYPDETAVPSEAAPPAAGSGGGTPLPVIGQP